MKTKSIIHREFKITFHFIMFFSLEKILLALVSSFDIFNEKRGFFKCDETIFKNYKIRRSNDFRCTKCVQLCINTTLMYFEHS